MMTKFSSLTLLFISATIIFSCSNEPKQTDNNGVNDSIELHNQVSNTNNNEISSNITVSEELNINDAKKLLVGEWTFVKTEPVNNEDLENYEKNKKHFENTEGILLNESFNFIDLDNYTSDRKLKINAANILGEKRSLSDIEKRSKEFKKGKYEITDKGTLLLNPEDGGKFSSENHKMVNISSDTLTLIDTLNFPIKFAVYKKYSRIKR